MNDLLKLLKKYDSYGQFATARFFADDDPPSGGDGDTGDGNDDPPKNQDGNTADGGSKKEPDNSGQSGTTYQLNVNGETREVTLDEMKEMAQKSAGADTKFQEAADMRKKAEQGVKAIEIAQELAKSQEEGGEPDMAKFNELSQALGLPTLDEQEVQNTMNTNNQQGQQTNQQGQQNNQQGQQGQQGYHQSRTPISKEDLAPEVKEAIDKMEEKELAEIRQEMQEETNKTLDNDKEIAKIVNRVSEDKKPEVKKLIQDMAFDDVRTQVLQGNQEFGQELLKNVAQKIRYRLKTLGTPSPGSGTPNVGPSGLHGLPEGTDLTEPIERVESTNENYEENAQQRIARIAALKGK